VTKNGRDNREHVFVLGGAENRTSPKKRTPNDIPSDTHAKTRHSNYFQSAPNNRANRHFNNVMVNQNNIGISTITIYCHVEK
jgi:hypothetical protein